MPCANARCKNFRVAYAIIWLGPEAWSPAPRAHRGGAYQEQFALQSARCEKFSARQVSADTFLAAPTVLSRRRSLVAPQRNLSDPGSIKSVPSTEAIITLCSRMSTPATGDETAQTADEEARLGLLRHVDRVFKAAVAADDERRAVEDELSHLRLIARARDIPCSCGSTAEGQREVCWGGCKSVNMTHTESQA